MATKEIKGMTDKEIIEKVKEEQFLLNITKMNHKISPVENPSKIKNSRREIARILTELNSRKKTAKQN